MKKKKTKRSKNKLSDDSLSTSKDEHSDNFSETSLLSDKSFLDSNSSYQELKIELSDNKDSYSKWIKSSWKNVALLHPIVMSSLSISNYVLIRSDSKYALCVAYPLRSIRRTTVFLPKDNLGFSNQDTVTISPYSESIDNAVELLVSPFSNMDLNEECTENILRMLSNRFIFEGMNMKFQLLDNMYEFKIIKISSEIMEKDLLHYKTYGESLINDLCDLSSLSLYDSKDLNLLSHEKSLNESSNLSVLSSTPTSSQDRKVNKFFCTAEEESKTSGDSPCLTSSTKYYVVSHKTKISVLSSPEIMTKTVSEPNFNQIIGLNMQLHFIKTYVEKVLISKEHDNHAVESGTLLFVGPAGTGKTSTMEAICNEYGLHSERINWYEIYSKSFYETENDLRILFKKAADRCPSLILMDDFHNLCPSKSEAKAIHLQIFNTLSSLIEELKNKKVLIVASTLDSDYDDEVLKVNGRILHKLKFQLPDPSERCKIFEKLLGESKHSLTPEELQKCVELSHGFSGKDILDVILNAKHIICSKNYLNRDEADNCCGTISFDVLNMTCKWKKPKIISGSNLKVKKVFWEDIGGMSDIKNKLKQLVEWPLKYPEAFKRFNITPSKGVLMYGPPGCSKTMIAKALATECDLNFISKNTSDLFQKWVGESEKAVRDLFVMARAKSPSIIFLDEIDALVAERGSCSGGSGVGDRIVTTLLTEIDGIEELHGVLIVAATNRPDMLDDALMRNGRINHFIYVPLPDIDARREILKIQMKNRITSDDFDFEYLSEKTNGYTGAEIVNICNEAALQLLAEDFEAVSPVFTMRHFEKALNSICPRTTKETIDFYEKFNSKFCIR